jgi:hypothetical protein
MPTIHGQLTRVVIMGLALLALGAATAQARDRIPPTAPKNLRVTAVTPYTVTLAWTPSTDNSGVSHYVICCANVSSQTAPGNVSTFVYTAGLEALRPFTLRMYAVDAAGNYSKPSNSVSFTTTRDVTPPTKPLVSVTGSGATHVSLMWSSIEDGPNLWFSLYMNGSPILSGTRNTSTIVTLLEPVTAYTFTVRAQDFGGNASPPSDPVTATTGPVNTADVTPPTTPANFNGDHWGDCEVALDWDESTDDFDPQFLIEYEVYVNDVYDHSTSLRFTRTTVYGNRTGLNTFAVAAVDTAGNRSERATLDLVLNCFP